MKLLCIAWIAAYPTVVNWVELRQQANFKDKIFPFTCMAIGIACAAYLAYFDKFWKEKKSSAAEKKALREASYALGHSVTMLAEVVSFDNDGESREKIRTVIDELCKAIRDATSIKLRTGSDVSQVNVFIFTDASGGAMKVMSRAVRLGELDEVPFPSEGSIPYHSAATRRSILIHDCGRPHPFTVPANLQCRAKYLMPLLKMHGDALYCVGVVSLESKTQYRFSRVEPESINSALMPYLSFMSAILWSHTPRVKVKDHG